MFPNPLPPITLYPGLHSADPSNMACTLLGLMHQSVIVRATMASVTGRFDAGGKEQYSSSLLRLNRQLLSWESGLGEGWRYTTRPTDSANTAQELESPNVALIFPGLNSMILWNTFWMTRLGVLQCLYTVYGTPTESSWIHAQMSFLVDNICMAVAYTTGRVALESIEAIIPARMIGALFAMRSLWAASQVPTLSTGKRAWIACQLEYIAKHQGIGQC